jgi:hypothetical protein
VVAAVGRAVDAAHNRSDAPGLYSQELWDNDEEHVTEGCRRYRMGDDEESINQIQRDAAGNWHTRAYLEFEEHRAHHPAVRVDDFMQQRQTELDRLERERQLERECVRLEREQKQEEELHRLRYGSCQGHEERDSEFNRRGFMKACSHHIKRLSRFLPGVSECAGPDDGA